MCSKSSPPPPADTGPPAPAAPPPKAAAAAPIPNEPNAADPAAAKKAGVSSLRNKRSFIPSSAVRPLVGSGLNIPT